MRYSPGGMEGGEQEGDVWDEEEGEAGTPAAGTEAYGSLDSAVTTFQLREPELSAAARSSTVMLQHPSAGAETHEQLNAVAAELRSREALADAALEAVLVEALETRSRLLHQRQARRAAARPPCKQACRYFRRVLAAAVASIGGRRASPPPP